MKKAFLALALCALSAGAFGAGFSSSDVNRTLGSFSSGLNETLPNAAAQQNVYSCAWIGKIFPSAPPHFGLGLEMGASKLDLEPLSEMASLFGVSGLPKNFVFPTVTANARVGGLFLPFDIGFSCMYLDLSNIKSVCDGFGIQFFNIGGDVRWALLKGEGAWPQLSVGAGYYYIGGKISFEKDGLTAGIDYGTHALFGQVQISKTLLFFTPYAGFRGIFSKSGSEWSWSVTASRAAAASTFTKDATSGRGTESTSWTDKFIPQLYGGFGFNFGYFALNLAGSYDFRFGVWGANLGLRFQM